MANLRDIRRRIRSVKSTQQITRAMKMVAAAKLRRSQDTILATRPYALELRRLVARLAARSSERRHPLLEERPEERVLVAVVTGDRGLAGAFNANVLRQAQASIAGWREEGKEVELLLLGKKGVDFYRRREMPTREAFTSLFANVTYEQAAEIADDVSGAYSEKTYDAVYVIFNEFQSIMRQVLVQERLLPVAPAEPSGSEALEYLYEPSGRAVTDELLPRYVTFQIYRILLESQAAEHAARMTAMDSATKNASEMIDRLTLAYNQARQAAITTELIEVVSGAAALEG